MSEMFPISRRVGASFRRRGYQISIKWRFYRQHSIPTILRFPPSFESFLKLFAKFISSPTCHIGQSHRRLLVQRRVAAELPELLRRDESLRPLVEKLLPNFKNRERIRQSAPVRLSEYTPALASDVIHSIARRFHPRPLIFYKRAVVGDTTYLT